MTGIERTGLIQFDQGLRIQHQFGGFEVFAHLLRRGGTDNRCDATRQDPGQGHLRGSHAQTIGDRIHRQSNAAVAFVERLQLHRLQPHRATLCTLPGVLATEDATGHR
ncbi:hypothetical protein D3C84_701890 [compost metagenome]